MLTKFFLAVLLSATLATAANLNQILKKQMFTKFEKAFKIWDGYNMDWEPHTLRTDEGYILTIMKVFSSDPDQKSKGSVILANGLFNDAASWFWTNDHVPDGPLPLPFRIVQAGYEVWLPNMRGTAWSSKHSYMSS